MADISVSPEHQRACLCRQPLPSTWLVKDFDVGSGHAASLTPSVDDGWIDIAVPGDLYLALHAAGRLPDPFGDRAEPACAWVKDRQWWYVTAFDAPSVAANQRLMLTFEGLDTFASIWINGEQLGATDNMFRAWSFDVSTHVRKGENRLAVCFTPTAAMVQDKSMPLWSIISDPIIDSKRHFLRKAQFGWGWDWGPCLPTVGIWRPVRLELETVASLRSVHLVTQSIAVNQQHAYVSVDLVVDDFTRSSVLSAEIELRAPDGTIVQALTTRLAGDTSRAAFTLAQPQLWWTPELGRAALYELSVRLLSGTEVIDQTMQRVGIRTIAIDTSPDADEPGTRFFRFVLNGVPIFARGSCWIPASSCLGAVDQAHYRSLLRMAGAAHMNMIRIWGGGIYEHDAFYDLCDELGLLVWQDFMFACAPYPEHDAAFVDNVRAEVRYQIERLRRHPSLGLWCGNNEGQAVQGFMNRMQGTDTPVGGALYYDTIMPQAIAELDPTTPYWPGSPTGGPSDNSMLAGDVHHWTVWHGLPLVPIDVPVGNFDHSPAGVAYTRYAEDKARFVSEFGIQAAPVMETLHRALPADQRVLGSEGLLNRIKDKPKDKVDAMLIPVTGLPTTLQEYVDFTQITQAEGLKFGIEHFRRRKPHCAGTLIWQYNDCWPGISWSLVDFYGFGKASYYYVRRAYAPVLASFKPLDDGAAELWITNDSLQMIGGEALIELVDFHHGVIFADSCKLAVPANTSVPVWHRAAAAMQGSPSRYLRVTSTDHAFDVNRWFFAPIKDLDRPKNVALSVKIDTVSSHELHVHLHAPTDAYFVHLLMPQAWTQFSDNYFDMYQGHARTIVVRNDRAPIDAHALHVAHH